MRRTISTFSADTLLSIARSWEPDGVEGLIGIYVDLHRSAPAVLDLPDRVVRLRHPNATSLATRVDARLDQDTVTVPDEPGRLDVPLVPDLERLLGQLA